MAQSSGNYALVVHWLLAAALLISLLVGAKAVVLCGIDSTKLNLCHDAVTGRHPPKPTEKCCEVVRHANLSCLCGYRSILPSVGINPTNALALPRRCGLTTPPECRET